MQKHNPLFEDMAKMASGAFSSVMEMRHEVERNVQKQFEQFSGKFNMVSREEFEVVRDMAQKAREENALLREEIEVLKASKSSAKAKTKPKTTAKKAESVKTGATEKSD